MEFLEVPAARKSVDKSAVNVSSRRILWQRHGLYPLAGPVILSVNWLTYDPPGQREQFGTESQVCFVRSHKIHFKPQQIILERETQHSSSAQKVRGFADCQDACCLN